MTVSAASDFDLPALTELFNAGFSGYLVPMHLSEQAFTDHVAVCDIELGLSRVVSDAGHGPVAFALVGRRGCRAWIGGMGTAPSHRRRGLGERALAAAVEAAAASGCEQVVLEVLEHNDAAVRLYAKLGFTRVRDLLIWSLPPNAARPQAASQPVEVAGAQSWIAAHRAAPEPWQRSDAAIEAFRRRGIELRALSTERHGEIAAAAIIREQPETAVVLQIAALDEAAAADILVAAAGDCPLRLTNVEAGDPAAGAMRSLGAECVAAQHEMVLRLTGERRS